LRTHNIIAGERRALLRLRRSRFETEFIDLSQGSIAIGDDLAIALFIALDHGRSTSTPEQADCGRKAGPAHDVEWTAPRLNFM
jgi:hypothetical protein